MMYIPLKHNNIYYPNYTLLVTETKKHGHKLGFHKSPHSYPPPSLSLSFSLSLSLLRRFRNTKLSSPDLFEILLYSAAIDGGCLVKLAFRPLDSRKIDGEEVQLTLSSSLH
ncbi:hypothetical protein HanRHA438_Chr05g0221351 [Helianthus annuus]|nr:hypothetical protein HanHA300_Chr05g0173541 [Helianthus annuus]KAJ0576753.1 hypothetical protein HanIR_Chr05g0228001 [Helianthus annuus]KAJ0584375.1 hypothetical protein HanHA89_Chr05g0187831 [Helianthus annuus]KAJ0747004.1 hypothetical protein HanOQP8_Chr05g0184411 [Helianthus annuus]KAJ0918733.1 hypothetical protein HanRHA438_Chr05g0221351 [Helianthus annuus]